MELNKTVVISGIDSGQTILELICFALNNTQSQKLEEVAAKARLLKKLGNEHKTGFATDEIVLIRNCCLQVLKDGATIAILEEIAPNDLS